MARQNTQDGLIGVLDIGSSKVVCLIARKQMDGNYKVIGVGNWACTGLLNGHVCDMDATEKAIRQSVELAEKMAGERLDVFTASIHCGQIASETAEADTALMGDVVTQEDVNETIAAAINAVSIDSDREIIHAFPAAYMVDGRFSPKAPLGMFGKRISVVMHLVTVLSDPLRTLETCVNRAGIAIDRIVSGPFASSLSTLHGDEKDMGAACIDLGGGTTSVAIFTQGKMLHNEVIQSGFDALTETIARELLTPIGEAERLKNTDGAALRQGVDDRIEIHVPTIGAVDEKEARLMPRSQLTALMQNHYDYVLRDVRLALDMVGFTESAARRVVLTGGAAQSEHLERLATEILGKDIRIAQPVLVAGLPLQAQNPLFACSVGLLVYNESDQDDIVDKIVSTGSTRRLKKQAPQGMLGKIGAWIKGSF